MTNRYRGQGIEDHNVEADCDTNEERDALVLRFSFVDERDPSFKAKVALEIEPAEAIDLIDKMIGKLGELGMRISVSDEGAEVETDDAADETLRRRKLDAGEVAP